MTKESDIPAIQWFPGHMAKTRRILREDLKLCDLAVELRDARIPLSSANPEINRLLGSKKRLLILNKSDMADASATKKWLDFYSSQDIPALAADCRGGKGLRGFSDLVSRILADELSRFKARGMIGRPLRLMIVGIPNVGKSSLINRLSSARRARVEDRPGVTRGRQWIKLDNGFELLDTPGVLWPKFEDPLVGEHLAFTGAVKDDILDTETLAARLAERLATDYSALLEARYRLQPGESAGLSGFDLLTLIGKKRGMLLQGGEINLERAAITLLDEFRAGLIGAITLEKPT